ncbi:MAG: hypothetical protein HY300_21005, partial [Verrucomicrobia bacterium]|nr:hypothetical protein [Verrucomicrobiota bacterium]
MRTQIKGAGITGGLAAIVLAGLMGAWAPQTFANALSYSGRAMVVSANIAGIPVVVSDTGPLPSSGGVMSASLL